MTEKNIEKLRDHLGERIKEESENLILVRIYFLEASILSVIEFVEGCGFEVVSASTDGGSFGLEAQIIIRK